MGLHPSRQRFCEQFGWPKSRSREVRSAMGDLRLGCIINNHLGEERGRIGILESILQTQAFTV
jgi:hypothetical protein